MLQEILAYVSVLVVIPAAYPLARALLAHSPIRDGRLLAWTLALALGIGLLTQIMFWMGVLRLPYSTAGIGILFLATVVLGTWVSSRLSTRARPASSIPVAIELDEQAAATPPAARIARLTYVISVAIVGAAILFNAVYWPFTRDDVVALYHPFAQQMARDAELIPLIGVESLHRMYPMNVPLTFTFAYLAAGWDHEYLARLLPALMSIACLTAAFILGRRLAGEGAGWLAALLLAITPMFGSWASTGYTELPMALYLTLAVIFALRLWESGSLMDAALLGVSVGLAAWTKNTALIAVPSLVVWLTWVLVHKRGSWRTALVALAACALVSMPWYVRNLIEVGSLLPDTAWVDQARRTLDSLLIFITLPSNFGVPGWAMLVGAAWAIWQLRKPVAAYRWLAILIWAAPFFAAWWLFASYDPRFLASILPLHAALGAAACLRGWALLPPTAQRIAAPTLAVVALGLAIYSAYFIVEYKDDILRDPLMSHEAKMAIVEARRNNR